MSESTSFPVPVYGWWICQNSWHSFFPQSAVKLSFNYKFTNHCWPIIFKSTMFGTQNNVRRLCYEICPFEKLHPFLTNFLNFWKIFRAICLLGCTYTELCNNLTWTFFLQSTMTLCNLTGDLVWNGPWCYVTPIWKQRTTTLLAHLNKNHCSNDIYLCT